MKKLSFFTFLFFVASSTLLMAENNETKEVDTNQTTVVESNQTVEEINNTKETTKTDLTEQQIEEQIRREEQYAKEQRFYQGDEYDLSSSEINEKSLEKLELIEPDFDFEMDDVYRDDL